MREREEVMNRDKVENMKKKCKGKMRKYRRKERKREERENRKNAGKRGKRQDGRSG